MQPAAPARSMSIRKLRTWILIALVAGVAGFTGVTVTLVRTLSERFGPQVQADLEWRALRGAHELARTADVGLAVSDTAMVQEAFAVYAQSSDVQAIVAVDAQGVTVASHGTFAASDPVFAAPPGTLFRGDGFVSCWAPVMIEGNQVGKVAVAVSTARRADAETVLARVSNITLIAGLVGIALGALVILFFTRAVSVRDHQLKDYAHNLAQKVEARTHELDERNRGMRLVLDNVVQGFVTIDLDGAMASERSAIVDRWFGEPAPGTTFGALIGQRDPAFAAWFALGLGAVRDGFLPLELCLEQMPPRFTAGDQTFEIKYSPITPEGELARILLIISDVTGQMIRERTEREQHEMVTLFQRITVDRAGFDEFMDEAAGLVASLTSPDDPLVERRTIHTLKGNCAIYGLDGYAQLCHTVESAVTETTAPIPDHHRRALIDGWRDVCERMARLLGEGRRNVVEIELGELARVVDRARQGVASRELAATLASWSHEPVARRFERLARYATALARRLGKGDVEIKIVDDGVRLETGRWVAFWSAMVHAIRNAVDHGIEPPEVRAAAGKPPRSRLTFAAARTSGELTISVSDDGGGVPWEYVRMRAREAGMPAETHTDLEQALFADGFSLSGRVSDVSGRGVGMAALRVAVAALGGTIEIASAPDQGTTFRFRFPEVDVQILPVRLPTQPLRTFL